MNCYFLTQLAAIKAHKPEDGPLGTAEKFYLRLSEIENLHLRVDAMLQVIFFYCSLMT